LVDAPPLKKRTPRTRSPSDTPVAAKKHCKATAATAAAA
jgi:hypothetical protein